MIPFENDDTRKKTLILTRGMNKKLVSKNENKNENENSNHKKIQIKRRAYLQRSLIIIFGTAYLLMKIRTF